ncbi:hypothetical protein BDV12DRAFT_181409 [Aspergillus spectabilis]
MCAAVPCVLARIFNPQGERRRRDQVTGEIRHVGMSGKSTAAMNAGDRIIVCTPGGGG